MFTGIIAAVGKISRIESAKGGLRLAIDAGKLGLSDLKVGDSVAVNGVCLTVVKRGKKSFGVDVSRETLRCTAALEQLAEVNLEKALRLSDRLDGHLVLGHVDGVGKVVRFEAVGKSRLLGVRAPADLARYIARKGSITVHGVSLTVNAVKGVEFEVNLIPHTLAATTLKDLRMGDRVNLEVDPLARYAERLLGKK
ncbi:MAG TPA: riboflavin synthase [Burkholderiales bacterium]|jgi:riboflavin synthase|nr:riboflavin synthase [Burkholderiales bacterium]